MSCRSPIDWRKTMAAFLSPPSSHSSPFLTNILLKPIPRLRRLTPSRPSQIVRAMRAIVQRVSSATVEVEGRIVSEIGAGFLVLVGVHDSDTDSDADYICQKVLNMRLFPNEKNGKSWDHSVMQKNYEVLLVSQFTLYGTLKGNKPDFHVAMAPYRAKPFYESLVDKFRKSYNPKLIKDGIFGAQMKVNLVNDGPVTFQLDSSQSSKANTSCSSKQETLLTSSTTDEAIESLDSLVKSSVQRNVTLGKLVDLKKRDIEMNKSQFESLAERERALKEREHSLARREAMFKE